MTIISLCYYWYETSQLKHMYVKNYKDKHALTSEKTMCWKSKIKIKQRNMTDKTD